MNAHVILVNDTPKAVVLGSELDAKSKIIELSEEDFNKKQSIIIGDTGAEKIERYNDTYFWHSVEVPVSANKIDDVLALSKEMV